MGRQHQNAARTRARCREALLSIKAGGGEWVRLPDLGTLDRMNLARDRAIEFRLVHVGNGFYEHEGRVNQARQSEYSALLSRFHNALAESSKGPRQRAAFNAIDAELSAFLEPKRLG